MGWTIGIPSLKLNKMGIKSKHCGDFQSVAEEALMERKGHDPDINPELSSMNIYEGYQTAAELMAYSDEHCNTLRDAAGRTLRKDAVRMCVTILKPPAAMMNAMTTEEQIRFLKDGEEKLCEIIGSDHVKSSAYHFDEQGAHVHIFWEPITEDGRLCAKEMHGLQFFGRLNREMPEYLRSKGWDIDDCNAYDAAQAELMSEQEKAQRRQKNGRSSVAYKATAQKELNEINLTIDRTLLQLDASIQDYSTASVEAAVSNETNAYENVLYLMVECDDERFAQLDQEGRELKRKHLQEAVGQTQITRSLHQKIAAINAGQKNALTWEERQNMWNQYKVLSNDFWSVRASLRAEYIVNLEVAYQKRRDAQRSYYDALYLLERSRGLFTMLLSMILVLSAIRRGWQIDDEITALKNERQQLIQNTATFQTYAKSYREELKTGQMPFEGYLESMAAIVEKMDQEMQKDINRIKAVPISFNSQERS